MLLGSWLGLWELGGMGSYIEEGSTSVKTMSSGDVTSSTIRYMAIHASQGYIALTIHPKPQAVNSYPSPGSKTQG